jgi:hypothetical protein
VILILLKECKTKKETISVATKKKGIRKRARKRKKWRDGAE